MTIRRRTSFTIAFLAALTLAVGGVGVWLLDDLKRRCDPIRRENYGSLHAMSNLKGYLFDAERLVLFAELQGGRLHPDVPTAFRHCLDGARAECRAELDNITVPGEQAEADSLAATIEVVATRGEAIMAARAEERHALYVDPDRGFQQAVTATWRHFQRIRAMNDAAMENADQAFRDSACRSVWTLSGTTALAMTLVSVAGVWLLRSSAGWTTAGPTSHELEAPVRAD